ncbi:hypothetical protein BV20DRAFT_959146, partial [Pilatotrama ljubarskyi]
MFAYCNRKHSTTGFLPFFMTHGHEAFTGVETKKAVAAEEAEQFAARMKGIQKQAATALQVAKDMMKRKFDKHHREAVEYNVGDWVLLDSFHI